MANVNLQPGLSMQENISLAINRNKTTVQSTLEQKTFKKASALSDVKNTIQQMQTPLRKINLKCPNTEKTVVMPSVNDAKMRSIFKKNEQTLNTIQKQDSYKIFEDDNSLDNHDHALCEKSIEQSFNVLSELRFSNDDIKYLTNPLKYCKPEPTRKFNWLDMDPSYKEIEVNPFETDIFLSNQEDSEEEEVSFEVPFPTSWY